MDEIREAMPLIVGGVALLFLGGMWRAIAAIHGLFYRATNGDEDSAVGLLKKILGKVSEGTDLTREHHQWAQQIEEDREEES